MSEQVSENVKHSKRGTTKVGVRGGSVCFTRPDAGNNIVGGPLAGGVPVANQRPLGVFINDARGLAFENSPGEASGRTAHDVRPSTTPSPSPNATT